MEGTRLVGAKELERRWQKGIQRLFNRGERPTADDQEATRSPQGMSKQVTDCHPYWHGAESYIQELSSVRGLEEGWWGGISGSDG